MRYLILLLIFFPHFLSARILGHIYKSAKQKKQLFTVEKESSTENGTKTLTTRYKNPEGQVAVTQVVKLKSGQLNNYTLKSHQTNYRGQIKVTPQDKVKFFYWKKGKKKSEPSVEKYSKNLVVSPLLGGYISEHLNKLTSGQTLTIRYGSAKRQESIEFELTQTKKEKWQGDKTVLIRMKIANWFLRALVNPLEFRFRPKDNKFLALKGRMVPKIQQGGEWENLEGYLLLKD